MNNFETVRPAPNLVCIIYSAHRTACRENRNPRWLPAAVLKFTIYFNKTANINVKNYQFLTSL